MRTIFFSDLDGTLLDSRSYSAAAAVPALSELRRRRIPLVFCSSKTRLEVEVLRRELHNSHPFVIENGGGILIPRDYFPPIVGAVQVNGYQCLVLGQPYREVAQQMRALARESRVQLQGFHQMTNARVSRLTGLSLPLAKLARSREFGEPFLFQAAAGKNRQAFLRLARRRGLTVQRGGRFWHLSAGCDKGAAVRLLRGFYELMWRGRARTVALGNSANDLPMLACVDHPVLLPRPGGAFDAKVIAHLPWVQRGKASGPEGWSQAVLALIKH